MALELRPEELLAWQRLGQYRNLEEFRGLKPILAPEIARCFSPTVHEGQLRPYGAIIARDYSPGDFGDDLREVADEEQLVSAADGVNTLAYCAKGQPHRLLRLVKPLGSQESYSRLAGRVDGVLARVDSSGTIWIASSDFVTTIDNKNGWTRPSADTVVGQLVQLAPTADGPALRAMTELAYSHFSPRKIGTTFLYLLTDEDCRDGQTAGTSMAELHLNVQNQDDWGQPMIGWVMQQQQHRPRVLADAR